MQVIKWVQSRYINVGRYLQAIVAEYGVSTWLESDNDAPMRWGFSLWLRSSVAVVDCGIFAGRREPCIFYHHLVVPVRTISVCFCFLLFSRLMIACVAVVTTTFLLIVRYHLIVSFSFLSILQLKHLFYYGQFKNLNSKRFSSGFCV